MFGTQRSILGQVGKNTMKLMLMLIADADDDANAHTVVLHPAEYTWTG